MSTDDDAPAQRSPRLPSLRLHCAVVLRVREDACELVDGGVRVTARYAPHFPTPRTERVSPGNLAALAVLPDGREVLVWRWYDAVVIGVDEAGVRMWEPAHGEVVARPRSDSTDYVVGTRAFVSAGLPGADWWVAARVDAPAAVDVDLEEVRRLYDAHDLWAALLDEGAP